MAKDSSVFEGAIEGSSFSNGGTKPTGKVITNGEPGFQKRTNSSRALDEVIRVTGPKVEKPTKG